MKKLIITASLLFFGMAAFGQTNAAPTLAKGTVSNKKDVPVVGTDKPELKANGKTIGAQGRQPADKPKPVMAAGSRASNPKK